METREAFVRVVQGFRKSWGGAAIAMVVLCLGLGPAQSEVPPQAFFADYFSGVVVLDDPSSMGGIRLVACIRDCRTFESQGIELAADGMFALLEVNPTDRFLRGDQILFYLVNAHGRIRAVETAVFEGKYAITELRLTFDSSIPRPMRPPELPAVGDRIIPMLPGYVMGIGLALTAGGISMLVIYRRRMSG